MSELQLALVGLGAAMVAAVWGFNVWQERKLRRQAGKIVQPAADDVLMAGREEAAVERQEPTTEPFVSSVPREPTFAEAPAEPETVAVPLPVEWADGLADCLLRIEFVDAVPVAALWAEKALLAAGVDKPMQWLGLDEKTARWRALSPQDPGNVTQLAIALQLTDRRGPIGEATLSAFLGGAHQLAQRFSGLVELPELSEVLLQANDLDEFCAGVDLQLALQVIPRDGSLTDMVGTALAPLLASAGLRCEGERYVATDAAGVERFAVTCLNPAGAPTTQLEASALTSVAFALDVPRVAEGAAAFDQMMALANQCAEALGGQVADAHRHALPEAKLTAIRGRIAELQAQMAGRDMPAGSTRALRLFS